MQVGIQKHSQWAQRFWNGQWRGRLGVGADPRGALLTPHFFSVEPRDFMQFSLFKFYCIFIGILKYLKYTEIDRKW